MLYFLILLPVLFLGCDWLKHEKEMDKQLEDIAVEAAKEQVKVGGMSLEEDVSARQVQDAPKKSQ